MFDKDYYLRSNPDVASAVAKGAFGGDPYRHFMEYGQKEGRAGVESIGLQRDLLKSQQAAPNPMDLYNKYSSELGVGDVRARAQKLRSEILNTENLLNSVEGSVQGRTSGALMTEAQRQRLMSLEREPLAKQYNKFSGDLNVQERNLSDLTGEAGRRAELDISGYKQKQDALSQAIQFAMQREKDAEDKRRWEAEMAAAAAKARAGSGGGLDLNSLLNQGNAAGTQAVGGGKPADYKTWVALLNELKNRGLNWGQAYAEVAKRFGFRQGDIRSGDTADLAFNAVFSPRAGVVRSSADMRY